MYHVLRVYDDFGLFFFIVYHYFKEIICFTQYVFSYASGLSIQKTLAEELHKIANVPLRQCNLDDVKTFQLVLPGYQIHIVSKESFNVIVYQGPEAEKKIYLYHHDNHNDVITTMSGFLDRSYFCQKCQKPL